jgi:molybdopterin molybdotransferase
MIEVSEALERIFASTPSPHVEELPLLDAAGRYLMEGVRAAVPLPGFDQSSMDGYALRSVDVSDGETVLRVVGVEAAGDVGGNTVAEGEAVRVLTGAVLPPGADAVVMQEDVDVQGDTIRLTERVPAGEFVRRAGEVVCRGQRIADRGDRLGAAKLGLLASQGLDTVRVGGLPKVGVVTTGDELVDPGEGELGEGQIFNSNATMLEAAARRAGIADTQRWHAVDDLDATVETLGEALRWSDVLLVAGGVSVGDRDFVKPALEACGVEEKFWRVRIKPGKPLFYGVSGEGKQVFGLPGNPVSALVGFEVFALPALRSRMGAGELERGGQCVPVRLAEDISNRGDRPQYVRGAIDARGSFVEGAQQGSHGLAGLADANALLRVEAGERLAAGELAMVCVLS